MSNEKTVWVLECRTYSGEDSMQAYTKEQDAKQGMREEIATERENLISEGYTQYTCTIASDEESGSVCVENLDIWYEWTITPCELIGEID